MVTASLTVFRKNTTALFAETDLRGRWIGHQAAVEILNAQNLWQEMAHVLAQRLMVLSMRSQEMMGWILI